MPAGAKGRHIQKMNFPADRSIDPMNTATARPTLADHSNRRPIADYALIGDMRGAALVASDGAIEWLCLGRFDADPTFAALLDTGIGGACTVGLEGGVTGRSRQYRDGTNILETTLENASGRLLVTDCMPVRHKPDQGDVGADNEAANRVLRCISCESGRVEVTVTATPGFDWGRRRVRPTVAGRLATWPGENLQMVSSHPVLAKGQSLLTRAVLSPGEHLVVVLGQAGLAAEAATAVEAHQQLEQTAHYWRQWQQHCTYQGEHSPAVLRSALCLKLLIYAPTGAMVAAPTTGLPEAPGGMRNWDYRFVWSRDASFSVSAFLALGHRREAAEFLRFLHGACHGDGPVRVMYAVEGELPEEQTLAHLAGWESSRPVLAGNAASKQNQHEIYGELLAALGLYIGRHGTEGLCAALVRDLPDFVVRLAEAAIEKWSQPDQGIWELRGEPRHLLHSKAMCWVAVDRAIKLAPLLKFSAPAHWAAERDAMHVACFSKGWNEAAGAYAMEFGSPVLDMSVLRLVLMDMIDAKDPRLVSTMAALEAELGHGDLFHRYRFDDGLPGREAAFIACSFWAMGVRSRQGDHDGARAMMGRMLGRTNDLGLLAEEMDVETGAQLGNFPQAFSHMALIHEAVTISEYS
jgi:GH15 family glucan-1,4-alpha-glucosidase